MLKAITVLCILQLTTTYAYTLGKQQHRTYFDPSQKIEFLQHDPQDPQDDMWPQNDRPDKEKQYILFDFDTQQRKDQGHKNKKQMEFDFQQLKHNQQKNDHLNQYDHQDRRDRQDYQFEQRDQHDYRVQQDRRDQQDHRDQQKHPIEFDFQQLKHNQQKNDHLNQYDHQDRRDRQDYQVEQRDQHDYRVQQDRRDQPDHRDHQKHPIEFVFTIPSQKLDFIDQYQQAQQQLDDQDTDLFFYPKNGRHKNTLKLTLNLNTPKKTKHDPPEELRDEFIDFPFDQQYHQDDASVPLDPADIDIWFEGPNNPPAQRQDFVQHADHDDLSVPLDSADIDIHYDNQHQQKQHHQQKQKSGSNLLRNLVDILQHVA